MIREVIVVEGKMDIAAVKRAVEAECLATGGFTLSPRTMKAIEAAYRRNGIIVLTDPDSAGERIRKVLTRSFPQAKHAFVPREAAEAEGDIGIEQASPEAIREALTKARGCEMELRAEFTVSDIDEAGLTGTPEAAQRRAAVGQALGIGYANAKTFLRRLNHYGVTREEFVAAVAVMEEKHA